MRVVAALGSFDLKTGRDHHPVDIDREGPQLQPRQDLRDHGGIERHHVLHALHREALEPAAHRARRGPRPYPRKALQQRIGRQIPQVIEAASAYHQESDQHAHHRDHAEVSAQARLGKGRADQPAEAHLAQVAVEQLQTRVRGELRVGELETKIPIDTGMQFGFFVSLSMAFRSWKKVGVATCFQPQRKAFFNPMRAPQRQKFVGSGLIPIASLRSRGSQRQTVHRSRVLRELVATEAKYVKNGGQRFSFHELAERIDAVH